MANRDPTLSSKTYLDLCIFLQPLLPEQLPCEVHGAEGGFCGLQQGPWVFESLTECFGMWFSGVFFHRHSNHDRCVTHLPKKENSAVMWQFKLHCKLRRTNSVWRTNISICVSKFFLLYIDYILVFQHFSFLQILPSSSEKKQIKLPRQYKKNEAFLASCVCVTHAWSIRTMNMKH